MTRLMTRPVVLLLVGLLAAPSPGFAQSRVPDLRQASIEDLMSIEITSAARKEQRVADTAAAVFVITQDDIRRSGMTTIPDLLRLAPGVDVAQINSNKWAVSVRGFNANYANKLLVLVDGRSIYNRIFSGVLWDTEDLMLDDVDRIEVIRGPGAVMWGANAVNAVINIVTKTAADTRGALARVDGGRAGQQAGFRYGGTLGAANYRLYSQWSGRGESLTVPDLRADDASHSVTTGFRADWNTSADVFMLQGAFTAGQARALWPNLDPATAAREPIADDPSDSQGGHLLGRLTRTRANGGSIQVQSFVDVAARQEPIGRYHRHAIDIDTQYHTPLGTRHDVVTGAGYRFIDEDLLGGTGISLTPDESNSSLFTAFVQDEIALFGRRLAVTLGSQVQYDTISGVDLQPTARLIWKGLRNQRVWAATSRAMRTPSLNEFGIRVDYPAVPGPGGMPLLVTALGNPDARAENLVDIEAGYRAEIGKSASIDVTGFAGRYDHLVTREAAAPVVQFVPSPVILAVTRTGNNLEATTRGLEIAGQWAPLQAWRLEGSYTAFHVTPHLAAGSQDPLAATEDGSAPQSQWQLRTAFSPVPRATVGAALFHVGRLEQLNINAYTRVDLSAEWRFTNGLSMMAISQNLFDAAHAEFGGAASLLLSTQVPRSAGLRLRWAF